MSLCILPTDRLFSRIFYDVFNEMDHLGGACPGHRLFRDMDRLERALTGCPRHRRGLAEANDSDKVTDDESKLALSMDVSKFKPEELKVNLEGRTLTIEGKQEVKDDNGYSMRSFVRQWTLPEEVDIEQVRSHLTENGQLSIEAPKTKPPAASARSIPIQQASKEQLSH
ncbi:hypothetical protein Q1695_014601 [Nippostrongylus brasiliensis]|nr:hypothetical protein Q1695_014601 [Nippostrongylus brasiliensis]